MQNNPHNCKCPFAPCFTVTIASSGYATVDSYTFYQNCEVNNDGSVVGLPGASDCEEIREEVREFWRKWDKFEEVQKYDKSVLANNTKY